MIRQQDYEWLFRKAPVMTTSIAEDGTYLDVNDAMLHRLGYVLDDMIGHKPEEFATPDSAERIVSELKEKNRREYQQHRTVHMPWGSHTLLEQHNECRVERLVVNPATACELPEPKRGVIHLTVLGGAAEIHQAVDTLLLQQGDTVSLESGGRSTLRNLQTEDVLTVICIAIPTGHAGLETALKR